MERTPQPPPYQPRLLSVLSPSSSPPRPSMQSHPTLALSFVVMFIIRPSECLVRTEVLEEGVAWMGIDGRAPCPRHKLLLPACKQFSDAPLSSLQTSSHCCDDEMNNQDMRIKESRPTASHLGSGCGDLFCFPSTSPGKRLCVLLLLLLVPTASVLESRNVDSAHGPIIPALRLRGAGIYDKIREMAEGHAEGRPGVPWGADDPRWEIPPTIPCRKPPIDIEEDEEESIDALMEWLGKTMTEGEKAQGRVLVKAMQDVARNHSRSAANQTSEEENDTQDTHTTKEPADPPDAVPTAPAGGSGAAAAPDFRFSKTFEKGLKGWAKEGEDSARSKQAASTETLDSQRPSFPPSPSLPPSKSSLPPTNISIFDRINSMAEDSIFVEEAVPLLSSCAALRCPVLTWTVLLPGGKHAAGASGTESYAPMRPLRHFRY
eukprot:2973226-Rhodomonas_salina.2